MIRKTVVIICLIICLIPLPSWSAVSTTTFNVTVTVSDACNISASNLNFGTFNPMLGLNLDTTTTLSVACTNGSPYNIGLNVGNGSGATVANRLMTRVSGGTDTLAYSLYQNSGHTTVWGNTIGTDTVTGTGNGNTQLITVYGRIFSSNPASTPPASYSDTITVTVTY